MVGDANFPEPGSATDVSSGRDDDVRSAVGSEVSAAKFVDNTIHHAVYERTTNVTTGQYMSVSRPTHTDFQVTHEKAYDFVEADTSLLLSHTTAPGVKDDVPPFFNDTKLVTDTIPPMLLIAEDNLIKPHSITTASKGSLVNLRNMEGRTLEDLGMVTESNTVKAGHIVDVGLRTTDLAMRLFRGKTHGLNSISISAPISGTTTEGVSTYRGANMVRHSNRFLSDNLRGVPISDILRLVARYDNYALVCDRYGNFIYAADGFSNKDRKIRDITSQSVSKEKVIDAANRVIVGGNSKALNDDIQAFVDDVELQKRDGVVKTMRVVDPTANSRSAARRSAAQLLRLNKKAQDAVKSKDLMSIWDLYPGDIIEYTSLLHNSGQTSRTAIIEILHNLSLNRSDITLLSYELGIEKVLMDLSELKTSSDNITGADIDVPHLDYSAVGSFTIKGRVTMEIRSIAANLPRVRSVPVAGVDSTLILSNSGTDKHSGFLIGHRKYSEGEDSGRGAIGIGLTPRLTGGTYDSPVIGDVDTTGFPSSGDLILNDISHVAYTGKTSTTFTGVSLQAGAAIPTGTGALSIRLLRDRGHEIRNPKGRRIRRML